MKLPNRFRVIWFFVLLGALTIFVVVRLPKFLSGNVSVFETVVFVIWIALLLTPLFQEISLFGLSFKAAIEEIKDEVKKDLYEMRAEIKASITSSNTVSPVFHNTMQVPSDRELEQTENKVKERLDPELTEKGINPEGLDKTLPVDEITLNMFRARYSLEKEIRRIYESAKADFDFDNRRGKRPLAQIIKELTRNQILSPFVADVVQDVYATTSAAVHADEYSNKQADFVREVTPSILAELRSIRP